MRTLPPVPPALDATPPPRGRAARWAASVLRGIRAAAAGAASRPWIATTAAWLIVLLVALAGAWLGLLVAGRQPASIGPLDASLSLRPSLSGGTDVLVTPLGSLEVDSHSGPVGLRVEVTGVDAQAARDIFDDPATLAGLDDLVATDLRSAVLRLAVRSTVVALVGAALAAALVYRSARRTAAAAGLTACVLAGSYAGAFATYDPGAITEPRYTGLLASAPSLVGDAQDIAANFAMYADQLARIVTNVSRLYDTTIDLPTFAPDDSLIRVLHVSDLHLNPSAWRIMAAVADQFGVDVIIDTGDIADHGTAPENYFVSQISSLDVPYVFVRGNHDSVVTEQAVRAEPNAVVLDGEVREVAGLRIGGIADPRFTPDKATGGDDEETLEEATLRLAGIAAAAAPPPDILLIHDATFAEHLAGAAPLVLAGHRHQRDQRALSDETFLMVQGSTGGAGLRALEGEEPTPVTLTVLYIEPESAKLLAWDDITLGGLGLASAEIQRRVAERADVPDEAAATPDAVP